MRLWNSPRRPMYDFENSFRERCKAAMKAMSGKPLSVLALRLVREIKTVIETEAHVEDCGLPGCCYRCAAAAARSTIDEIDDEELGLVGLMTGEYWMISTRDLHNLHAIQSITDWLDANGFNNENVPKPIVLRAINEILKRESVHENPS